MVQAPLKWPIASVVGLNEAGKSFLLDAIWKVLTGANFELADVCRYSWECRIEKTGLPQVGLVWEILPAKLIEAANALPKFQEKPIAADSSRLLILKQQNDCVKLVWFDKDGGLTNNVQISKAEYVHILDFLPRPFRVNTRTFLPSSVPMRSMFKIALDPFDDGKINAILKSWEGNRPFDNCQQVRQHPVGDNDRLVYRLFQYCANLNHESLYQIWIAPDPVRKEFSKQAAERAEDLLNLGHWWGQDVDAQLSIDLRRDDVLLNVTDRTSSWYGFAERSQGMKYFLGYILQILLEFKVDSRPLLILSDEPDFALSAIGQRDLLRFFKEIVTWDRNGAKSQLIFTTHSPEFIDPNFPDRVTILRKGTFDEGTTVMNRAHHNLFEPVRTALGARVCSFPFIDAPNLIVEGLGDRTFIVRMSQFFAKRDLPHLDLAYLSIVVAEGADRIPRIALTARSVAGDRAYATILLDNDQRGRAAAEGAKQFDDYLEQNKQVVMTDDILGQGLGKDVEIEDIIPVDLYYRAFCKVMKETLPAERLAKLPPIEKVLPETTTQPVVDVMETTLKRIAPPGNDGKYDKEAVIVCAFDMAEENDTEPSVVAFVDRLKKMTAILIEKVNANLRNRRHEEVSRAMRLLIREFTHVNPLGTSKSRVEEFLSRVRELGNRVSAPGAFDKCVDSILSDFAVRQGLRSEPVRDYPKLFDALKQLPQRVSVDPNMALM
jgi:energy-coupling factor transporter ATP-binding protein EcfA2